MKLIVGLGNPGGNYTNNRHNVGHQFIDHIVTSLNGQIVEKQIGNNITVWQFSNKCIFVKTNSFMNQSGQEIKRLIHKSDFLIQNLIAVHDDLDIPLGKFKIQQGAGPKLHNGITSIEKALKTKDFLRVRIGIDDRSPDHWIDGERYVLSDFFPDEKKRLEEAFEKILLRLRQEFLS